MWLRETMMLRCEIANSRILPQREEREKNICGVDLGLRSQGSLQPNT
jgi:hypothetical protein